MKDTKYYVSMTDKFLSGWGVAENKISKYIVICDNKKQALEVAECAGRKYNSEMAYIRICKNKPNYNTKRYVTSYTTYNDARRFHYSYIPAN